ncbi:putative mitogen-activated protein kinase kinase kinase 7-like isoform X1 [Drosophila sulfurigaster albostrigata]|uniref:putative mitogen-activated protein kinase kinase kinase 7-like isoform X1 n=1 Tax=Drosophila sulfurigaster albostrigata TaxID=89887 RepID=UPI002D2199DB|nr:putative mitogen-activated protein kinase kinase kinase 7-like isoform X1 [Drosophila sulfurigaster albostrigata]
MRRTVTKQEIERFLSTNEIGRGTFGVVYRGTLDDGDVAIKVLQVTEDTKEKVEREITTMRTVKHENIVEFIAELYEIPKLYLIFEFMDGPSLHQIIHKHNDHKYTNKDAINWLTQAAQGLNHLHSLAPILHRDVKPKNILLNEDKSVVKLCDFGNVRPRGSCMSNETGTYRYMAPEQVYNYVTYNEKCDVYSFAITAWEVYSRTNAYGSDKQNYRKLLTEVSTENRRPSLEGIPEYTHKLLERSWSPEPKTRPTMKEILEELKKPDFCENSIRQTFITVVSPSKGSE